MNAHLTQWLEAYVDGELEGYRLRKAKQHLATCERCRAEVTQLRSLNHVLQQFSMPATAKNPQRFVDEVRLQLPSRAAQPVARSRPGAVWWMIASALLGAFAFVQIAWGMSVAVMCALQFGFGDLVGMPQWVSPVTAGMWHALVSGQWLSAGQLAEIWQALRWLLVLPLEVSGALALLYCSWLIGWGVYRRWSPDEGITGAG